MTPGRRPGSRTLARVLVLVVVAAALVALARGWDDTAVRLRAADLRWVGVALLLGLGNVLAAALAWRSALAALGSPLPVRPAVAVFCAGQLGKYVPGSVWSLLLQAQLAAQRGVPRDRVVVAGLLALAEGLAALLAVGVVAVPSLLTGLGASDGGALAGGLAGLALAVAGLAAATSPRLVAGVLGRLLRWTRRPPLTRAPDRSALLRVLSAGGAGALGLGAHGAALAAAVGASPATCAATAGGLVLASAIGLLALPVPAGVGVREAVLVAVLAPVAPVPTALAVAVLSRLVLTVSDLLGALLGAVAARRALSPQE